MREKRDKNNKYFGHIEELLESFHYRKNAHIGHFSDNDEELSLFLSRYCYEKEYLYQINSPSKEFAENIKQKLSSDKHARSFYLPLQRPRYRMGAKEFDYLLITIQMQSSNRLVFLKKCYELVRSQGKIVIFLSKTQSNEYTKWYEDLEESLYVAISRIDDLLDDQILIIATKMHGYSRHNYASLQA